MLLQSPNDSGDIFHRVRLFFHVHPYIVPTHADLSSAMEVQNKFTFLSAQLMLGRLPRVR